MWSRCCAVLPWSKDDFPAVTPLSRAPLSYEIKASSYNALSTLHSHFNYTLFPFQLRCSCAYSDLFAPAFHSRRYKKRCSQLKPPFHYAALATIWQFFQVGAGSGKHLADLEQIRCSNAVSTTSTCSIRSEYDYRDHEYDVRRSSYAPEW